MPIHDWTRVAPADFHHFHGRWIFALADDLNDGLLPNDYYAIAERTLRTMEPDVLALQEGSAAGRLRSPGTSEDRLTSLLVTPPRVAFTAEIEPDRATVQWSLAIRQVGDDRIVAVIEIVSPANKGTRHALDAFVAKAETLILTGIHLTVLDLFPPNRRNPAGIHAAIWDALGGEPFTPPADRPLTLVAYAAGTPTRAFVEPTAVGRTLAAIPLFLDPDRYIPLPLEATYQTAWQRFPRRLRDVVEKDSRS
jgi:hypothetical protein